jgi:hypothetical protein
MGFSLDLLDQLLHRHVGRAPNAELAEATDRLRGIRGSRAPPSDIGGGRNVWRMSRTFKQTSLGLRQRDHRPGLHVNGRSYMA